MARKIRPPKPPKAPTPKSRHLYTCFLCDGEAKPEFDGQPALFKHLRAEHPEVLDEQGRLPVQIRSTAHWDGPEEFGGGEKWLLKSNEQVAVVHSYCCEREENDPMRFFDE